MHNDSPLQHLTSNAITFVAGALTAMGIGAYMRHVDQRAREEERERLNTATDTPAASPPATPAE